MFAQSMDWLENGAKVDEFDGVQDVHK